MSNDNKIWNGGDTNKYDRMIRESEDYIDGLDMDKEPFNPRDTIRRIWTSELILFFSIVLSRASFISFLVKTRKYAPNYFEF